MPDEPLTGYTSRGGRAVAGPETLADYELLGELGRGGMGRVVRARHRPTGAERALKLLEGAWDPELLLRFQREAEVLARVGGEGVVPVHAAGTEAGRAWLAMAIMPGGSLRDRLRRGGRLPWPEALELGIALGEALQRCHAAGLVHRDLKPENVLFDAQGRPRLADFGAARDLTAASLTETGATLGTPRYMAPEQLSGKPVDARADLWALGAILHEAVCGAPPFAPSAASPLEVLRQARVGRRPRAAGLVPGVPAGLDVALDRALEPDPGKRVTDASTLVAALRGLRDAPAARASRGRRVAAALALLALGAGGLGLRALGGGSAPSPPPPPSPRVAAAAPPPAPAPPAPAPVDPIALLEGARTRLRSDPERVAADVAALASAQPVRVPTTVREAFVREALAACARDAQVAADAHFDPLLYVAALRPYLLARQVAALEPGAMPPPEAPDELQALALHLHMRGSINDPRVQDLLVEYAGVQRSLAVRLAEGLDDRLAEPGEHLERSPVPAERARDLLEAVAARAPGYGWVDYVRARVALAGRERPEAERDHEALALLRRALEDGSLTTQQEAWVRMRLAAILERQGEAAAALALLEGAHGPRDSEPWTKPVFARLQARLLLGVGREGEVEGVLRVAAERCSAPGASEELAALADQAAALPSASPAARAKLLEGLRPRRERGP